MRARFLLAVMFLGALWSGQAASPMPALACSCVAPEPMATYRGDSNHMILEGRVASVAPTGVEVEVERWYQGPGGATITFAPDGFGDQSAACQDPWPAVGSRWFWIAWVPEVGARPQTNLCTPKAALDTTDGERMVAEARAALGQGSPVQRPGTEPADEGEAPVQREGESVPVAAIGGVGLAVVLLFAGVALVARRRATEG